jgi:phage tail-like protein
LNKKIPAVALIIMTGVVAAAFILRVSAPLGSRPTPLLKYNFLVEIDGVVEFNFMQVEGLNVTVDVVEFREGGETSSPILMPGLAHYGPLVLRNGVTTSTALLDWMQETVDGTMAKKSLSVIVLNAQGTEVARYNVYEAWPSSWRLGKMDSLGVGPVIEELVVQYESFEPAY